MQIHDQSVATTVETAVFVAWGCLQCCSALFVWNAITTARYDGF